MIQLTDNVKKRISNDEYYSNEMFTNDCKEYIDACRSGRLLYRVVSVARSGMSRHISITAYVGSMDKGGYRNFYAMLKMLGYKVVDHNFGLALRVGGCGMDLCFNTNYNIIYSLFHMNFIDEKDCEILAQKI